MSQPTSSNKFFLNSLEVSQYVFQDWKGSGPKYGTTHGRVVWIVRAGTRESTAKFSKASDLTVDTLQFLAVDFAKNDPVSLDVALGSIRRQFDEWYSNWRDKQLQSATNEEQKGNARPQLPKIGESWLVKSDEAQDLSKSDEPCHSTKEVHRTTLTSVMLQHCSRGHEFTADYDLLFTFSGVSYCPICFEELLKRHCGVVQEGPLPSVHSPDPSLLVCTTHTATDFNNYLRQCPVCGVHEKSWRGARK